MAAEQKFFRLYGDTIMLNKGVNSGGVLYLLVERKMFCLQPSAVAVLWDLEKNLSIEAVAERTGRTMQDISELLTMLQAAGAGSFLPHPYYIEKIRSPNPLLDLILFRPQVQLQRLHVYLTNRCTMDCQHCGQTSVSRLRACEGCGRIPKPSSQNMDLDKSLLKKTLDDASRLEFQTVTFHVGDSAIVEDLVVDALRAASNYRFGRIELITGGGTNGLVLEALIEVGAFVTFQVYAGDAKQHDSTCGRVGTFDEILRSIQSLGEAGMPFALIYLRADSGRDIGPSLKRLTDLRPDRLMLDRLVTRAFLDDAHKLRMLSDECLSVPDVASYLVSLERSCMYGQMSLGHDGCLYACPFLTDTKLENAEFGISNILAKEIAQPYWRDGVLSQMDCYECQFRLACTLCPSARVVVDTDGVCALALDASTKNQTPLMIEE